MVFGVFEQRVLSLFEQMILSVFEQMVLSVFEQRVLSVFGQMVLSVFEHRALSVFEQMVLSEELTAGKAAIPVAVAEAHSINNAQYVVTTHKILLSDNYEGVSKIFQTGAAIYTAVVVARSTGPNRPNCELPGSAATFCGDCVKTCEDVAPNLGENRPGCFTMTTHRQTLPSSPSSF
jgi:hypothetical protein